MPVLELDDGERLTDGRGVYGRGRLLFTVTSWAGAVGVDIERLSRVGQFMARMRERPAVQAALRAEGLLK